MVGSHLPPQMNQQSKSSIEPVGVNAPENCATTTTHMTFHLSDTGITEEVTTSSFLFSLDGGPPSQQGGVNINTVGKQVPADVCAAADTICSGRRRAFAPRGLGARAQSSRRPDELSCLPVSIATRAARGPVGGVEGAE